MQISPKFCTQSSGGSYAIFKKNLIDLETTRLFAMQISPKFCTQSSGGSYAIFKKKSDFNSPNQKHIQIQIQNAPQELKHRYGGLSLA